MRLRAAVAPLVAIGALGLGACSVPLTPTDGPSASPSAEVVQSAVPVVPFGELDLLDDPHAYEGPSTAVISSAMIEPLAEAPTQQLPATVISHERAGDVDVTVTDTSRIVAMDLSGSIAATVYALGLGPQLVGRDSAAEFPGSDAVAVVTGASHTVNAEAILDVEPTLVLTDGSLGPTDAIEQLEDAGVTVVFVANDPSFDGAQDLAREVGAALGLAELGDQLASAIDADVSATAAEIAAALPDDAEPLRMAFVYLRGSAGVYYLFGDESGADDLIAALGGIDAAAEAGIEGMRPLTDEAMLAADPDVILVMTEGLESVGGVDGLLAERPAIALTTAGQHRRIVDMDDRLILAFGPRSAAILDALARAIYAPTAS